MFELPNCVKKAQRLSLVNAKVVVSSRSCVTSAQRTESCLVNTQPRVNTKFRADIEDGSA